MNIESATHILQKSPDAIVIQTQGIIRYANPAAGKLFGVNSEDALIGLRLLDLVDDQYRKEAEARLDSLINHRVDFSEPVDRLYHQIDGTPIWVELVGERIDYEGIEGTVVYFRQIGKRKTLEQKAQKSEQFYRSVLDSLPLSIVHFCPETGIHFVNSKYIDLFGWDEEYVSGKKMLEQIYPDPKIREEAEQLIERSTGEWKVFPVHTRSGEQKLFEWSNSFLSDGTRISIGIDVTENHRAETTIKELLQEKDRLLREVHHRVKNNMVTMTSLLTLQSEMTDLKETASQLIHARNRMLTMATLYEHLNRSKDLEHIPLKEYLGPLIEDIIENLDPPFVVDLSMNLQSILISVTKASLLGIITNEIITNSVTHGFTQGMDCKLVVESTIENGAITMIFADNGKGCNIFQLESPGLGAQLISLLVEQVKGHIIVQVDQGTKMVIQFPLDRTT
jgi:PAS domain S-box-containing protein